MGGLAKSRPRLSGVEIIGRFIWFWVGLLGCLGFFSKLPLGRLCFYQLGHLYHFWAEDEIAFADFFGDYFAVSYFYDLAGSFY
jgi:hypothetical protein